MITLYAATINDIELINTLAQDIFYTTYRSILSPEQLDYMFSMMYSLESLRDQIEVKGAQYFIARKDGEECGYISIISHGEAEYHLDKIYILKPFQGLGLGRDMVEFAINYLCSNHREGERLRLTLNVNRNNRAVGFYHAIGFTVAESGDFDIGGGYFMNDYIMELIVVNGNCQ